MELMEENIMDKWTDDKIQTLLSIYAEDEIQQELEMHKNFIWHHCCCIVRHKNEAIAFQTNLPNLHGSLDGSRNTDNTRLNEPFSSLKSSS